MAILCKVTFFTIFTLKIIFLYFTDYLVPVILLPEQKSVPGIVFKDINNWRCSDVGLSWKITQS